MAWPHEPYVILLTDLLSPSELPRGTLASIALHVGNVEDAGLARLAFAMLQSPTLFGSTPYQEPSTSARKSDESLALKAAQDLFHAVRQGIDSRVQDLKKAKGNAWSKRRKLQRSLELFLNATSAANVEPDLESSLKCLVLSTAALRAVQDDAARKDAFVKPDGTLLRLCERYATSCFSKYASLSPFKLPERLPSDNDLLVAWAAAQVLPEVPSERLRALASPAFFDFGFSYIRACFMDGGLFNGITYDVSASRDGLLWPTDSASSLRVASVKSSLSHALLGRFSRSLGKVIESVESTDVFYLLLPQLESLESMAERIHLDWAACRWSNVSGPEDMHPESRSRDEPWTIFKTLLFTLTMIFSSLISLMNAMPLPLHRAPENIIVDLAACALRTFSSIFFVTSKFGTSGFGAYQNVWYSAVDLVSRAQSQKIEQIAKSCEPRFDVTQRRDAVLPSVLARSRMTYWLNLVEQLVLPIPEDYLAVTVIPTLRPYLMDKQDTEAFESAHSVLLAIFGKKKALAIDVAPWYSDLLLRSYPDQLSIPQLRLAYATMVGCLTELESGKCDACLSKLLAAIESLAPGPSHVQAADLPLAHVSQPVQEKATVSGAESQGASAKELEAAALRSRRGHLLLVLIDQLSTTSLEKMEELLPRVQEYLHEERRAPKESQVALIQVLFNTLSGGMDMIKRETAAKWWLEHRADIERDENSDKKETTQTEKGVAPGPQARL